MNETARFNLIAVGVIGVLFSPLAFFMGTCTRPAAPKHAVCRLVNDTYKQCPFDVPTLRIVGFDGQPDIDVCLGSLLLLEKAEAIGCGKNVKGGIWYAD